MLCGIYFAGHYDNYIIRLRHSSNSNCSNSYWYTFKTSPNGLVIRLQGMKSDSNDIKQLVSYVVELVSRVANQGGAGMDESSAKVWIPALLSGTKEKNSTVKAASEYALITLLQLRQSDAAYKVICV